MWITIHIPGKEHPCTAPCWGVCTRSELRPTVGVTNLAPLDGPVHGAMRRSCTGLCAEVALPARLTHRGRSEFRNFKFHYQSQCGQTKPIKAQSSQSIENCIGSRPPSDPTTKNHPNERFLDIACPEVWIVHLTSGLRPRHQKLHGLKATLKHVEEHPLEYLV